MLKSSSLSSQPSPSIVPAKKSADFEAVAEKNNRFQLPADGGMFRRTRTPDVPYFAMWGNHLQIRQRLPQKPQFSVPPLGERQCAFDMQCQKCFCVTFDKSNKTRR
jgi:hypothetical protein